MSKPFDATLNAMIDLQPGGWAACFARLAGIPPGPSVALDTDLATTLQADKVFRIDGERPGVLHLELQSTPRLGIPRELMRYNTLVDHREALPVETVLILLRPKALASDQTGVYQRHGLNGGVIAEFRYHVVRVWELPIDFWLGQGIGLAPLALLTDEASTDLDSALTRVHNSLRAADTKVMQSLLGSTYVLCGLRYTDERIAELFRSVSMLLEDSTTYQAILRKGVSQGVTVGQKGLLLMQGTERFGPPPESIEWKLQNVTDTSSLAILAKRILVATGWEDLLADVQDKPRD